MFSSHISPWKQTANEGSELDFSASTSQSFIEPGGKSSLQDKGYNKSGTPKAQVSQVNRDKQSVTSFPNQNNSAVVPSIRKISGLSTGSFTANLNAPQNDL